MEGSLQIGTLFGIPIRLHWTFLLVIPLFAWIIGSQIQLTTGLLEGIFGIPIDPSLITAGFNPYILGGVVSLGLFFGVFIHELAHSLIARANRIKINSITLLILGGVSSMEDDVPDPRVELPMALSGPLTSLLVGLVCIGLMYAHRLVAVSSAVEGVWIYTWGYLGLLNVILFGFNLIPAFPMDGGRVLRAWLAKRMPLTRATKIAADIGKVFAVLFGIFGFVVFNPILIIIAFFIYIGASQESAQVQYNVLLKDLTLGDVMSGPVMTVPPDMPLPDILRLMYTTKHLGFPVVEHGTLIGMITLDDVHRTQEIDRDAMRVKDVMTRQVLTLPPSSPLTDALRIMSVKNIGRIPVVADNALVGIVTRTDILKVMELREG